MVSLPPNPFSKIYCISSPLTSEMPNNDFAARTTILILSDWVPISRAQLITMAINFFIYVDIVSIIFSFFYPYPKSVLFCRPISFPHSPCGLSLSEMHTFRQSRANVSFSSSRHVRDRQQSSPPKKYSFKKSIIPLQTWDLQNLPDSTPSAAPYHSFYMRKRVLAFYKQALQILCTMPTIVHHNVI